jgi:hypothetical protein
MVAGVGLALATVVVVGGIDEGGWALPACLVGGFVVLAGTWRHDRMRVQLGREVVVVNFWRTVVLPWAEIERFGYDVAAWVERRDGRRQGITPFSPAPGVLPFVERRCREAVLTMEARRKQRGHR